MTGRSLRTRSDFQALTGEDFAELANLSRRPLPANIRATLNRQLLSHCGPTGDRLVVASGDGQQTFSRQISAHKQIATLANSLERSYEQLKATKHYIFWGNAIAGTREAFESQAFDVLETLCKRANEVAEHLRTNRKGRGPEPNHWIAHFVFIAAQVFQAAGGRVSTAYQKNKRGRGGPFLRFLWALHQRLPEERQARSMRALFDLAHRQRVAGNLRR